MAHDEFTFCSVCSSGSVGDESVVENFFPTSLKTNEPVLPDFNKLSVSDVVVADLRKDSKVARIIPSVGIYSIL